MAEDLFKRLAGTTTPSSVAEAQLTGCSRKPLCFSPDESCCVFPRASVSVPKPDDTGYRCYCNHTIYLKITSTYEIWVWKESGCFYENQMECLRESQWNNSCCGWENRQRVRKSHNNQMDLWRSLKEQELQIVNCRLLGASARKTGGISVGGHLQGQGFAAAATGGEQIPVLDIFSKNKMSVSFCDSLL